MIWLSFSSLQWTRRQTKLQRNVWYDCHSIVYSELCWQTKINFREMCGLRHICTVSQISIHIRMKWLKKTELGRRWNCYKTPLAVVFLFVLFLLLLLFNKLLIGMKLICRNKRQLLKRLCTDWFSVDTNCPFRCNSMHHPAAVFNDGNCPKTYKTWQAPILNHSRSQEARANYEMDPACRCWPLHWLRSLVPPLATLGFRRPKAEPSSWARACEQAVAYDTENDTVNSMFSIVLSQERCPAAVGNVTPSIISAIAWKPRCKWLRAVGGVVLHVSLWLCWNLAAKSVSVVRATSGLGAELPAWGGRTLFSPRVLLFK